MVSMSLIVRGSMELTMRTKLLWQWKAVLVTIVWWQQDQRGTVPEKWDTWTSYTQHPEELGESLVKSTVCHFKRICQSLTKTKIGFCWGLTFFLEININYLLWAIDFYKNVIKHIFYKLKRLSKIQTSNKPTMLFFQAL